MTDAILSPEALVERHTGNKPLIVNNVLYGCDAIVAAWMNEKGFDLDLTIVGFVAMGIIDPKRETNNLVDLLIGGCYFYNHFQGHNRNDISVAAVMTEPAASHRSSVRQILSYPFQQLGLKRISAECDPTNHRLLRQLDILGFVKEGEKPFVRDDGGPFCIFGLYADRCPFWTEGN